ncbi:MAG: phosphatase PAP2 family protein [Cocleimonas sp.]|nr:phosphatase PAP2 family protein [Cocleimonas sp.]
MFSKSPNFIIITLFIVAIIIFALNANAQLFLITNKLGSVFANEMWIMITTFGNRLFALLLVLIFFWRHLNLLRTVLIAALISLLIVASLKSLIALPRPYDVLEPSSFYFIGEKMTTYAFPSGHTATAFAIMGSVGFYFKNSPLLLFAFFFACLIGLSRIMLGVHWPIDILIGAALGWASAWLSVAIINARFIRDAIIWNYVTYLIYLLIAGYLFWQGSVYSEAFWLVKVIAAIGIFVAISSLIWLFKGGNKEPISVTGWLS